VNLKIFTTLGVLCALVLSIFVLFVNEPASASQPVGESTGFGWEDTPCWDDALKIAQKVVGETTVPACAAETSCADDCLDEYATGLAAWIYNMYPNACDLLSGYRDDLTDCHNVCGLMHMQNTQAWRDCMSDCGLEWWSDVDAIYNAAMDEWLEYHEEYYLECLQECCE